VYFAPLLKGSPWYWVSALEVRNQNDDATGSNKKFDDIFSRVDTIYQRDRQTDPDDSKDRAYA